LSSSRKTRSRAGSRARSTLESFRLVLDGLAELSGLTFCVHDLTGFTRSGEGSVLPKRLRVHSDRFCAGVKRRRQSLCYRDDFRLANARAGQLRRPFVKRCHAGVSEVVVPVLVGGRHVGTIFAGPLLEKGRRPPAGAAAAAGLPVRAPGELKRLGRLISVIAGFAAQAGEALMIQELEASARSEPVRRALRFAARRYADPITVADASREAFLSTSRFAHVFSDEMGLPFHRYVQALRIGRAKSLLAGSSMRVIDVAARCGFCNQNYFASVFKRAVGATPREYRRSQQESIDI
jgi:AraC-like DNA-binding protein